MPARLVNILNVIIKVTMITGVIITFGNLKGCFVDRGKSELYKTLMNSQSNYRASVEFPAVKDFLKKFYYSK